MTLPATPPGNLKYCRPSDIITSSLSWTAAVGTISSDTNYQAPALYDQRMAKPLKFIDDPAIAVRLVGDAGVGNSVRIDALSLPNSKSIAAGQVMRAELNNTNVWTAPTVSVDMTMGASGLDGHVASPWADFTTASGYTTAGFRYVSLYIPAQSVAPWVGELPIISNLRSFSQWPQFGDVRGINVPFLENLRTEYEQLRVIRRRIRQRLVNFTVRGNDSDYDDLIALAEDSGGMAVPFFLVHNSTIKTDGGLYGRFTPETAARLAVPSEWFDLNSINVSFIEDSRSIPL